MKQVLLIVRNFPPVRHSGTIRVEAFARHLPSHGYHPTVLYGATPPALRESTDRVLPADQRLEIDWSSERSLFRRRWGTLPVGFSHERSRGRALLSARSIEACQRANYRPDLILASCQPGDTLVHGQALSKHFRCPLVCDFRDPWSHWPMPLYPHWIDYQFERRCEQSVLNSAIAMTVTTQASAQILEQSFRVPSHKIHLIPNGYEPADFDQQVSQFDPIAAEPGRFHIVYAGEIGTSRQPSPAARFAKALGFQYDPLHTNYAARSPRWFLEGLGRFLSLSPEAASQMRVWFIGDAKVADDPVVKQFAAPDLLRIVPRVPPAVAAGAMQQASLLLMLQLETFFQGQPLCVAIPGKLYSYLASGKRILAAVQKSENTELIERFQAGTCVSPTSASEFAAAINAEFDRWKSGTAPPDQPRKIPEFERAYQAGQLAQLFDSLLSSSALSPAAAATA